MKINLSYCTNLLPFFLVLQSTDAQSRERDEKPIPAPTPAPTSGLPVLEAFYTQHVFQVEQMTTCETYSMSEYSQNYETNDIDGSFIMWGLHALQWKGYNHMNVPQGTFDAWLAASSNPPGPNWPNHVTCPDKDVLNSLELASSNIFKTNGVPVNPTGTWVCVTEPDYHVGAVTAAMSMHYWNTPTYLDANGCLEDANQDYWCIVGAVIEKVTLCAAGNLPPHEVCDWDTFDWTTNHGTIGACAASLVLDSIEFGIFIDIITSGGQPWFRSHATVSGADWANHYGNWDNDVPDLVFDPPAEASEEAIATMHEMAKATAENLIVVDVKGDDVEIFQASDLTVDKAGGRN